ncbi:Predicted kinase, aminoglycoside phosphotransferase (APT) family [Ruminococcus sp. YRD2003]|uniref:phosphotransferase enzyme family protein n=1 Tax=Ruminococcus sp. YRD2003 TaxID=1452313 RepID=UPI0008AAF3EB|nr:Predicted kinase, aminoglycoside phosphotransferase (APT) family [Ruminococcus flavefaciens]
MEIERIAVLFGVAGICGISEVVTGHINRTYIVTAESGRYVLQSLNHSVFPRPEAVMSNIAQVAAAFADQNDVRVPHFLTCNGRNFAESDGDIWRMYAFCEDSARGGELRRTGYAYGTFIRVMSCSGAQIQQVIDGFHNYDRYYARLTAVCTDIPPELTALRERLSRSFEGVPVRVIHGDAKTDNVIVGEPCTILDLDTVMLGAAALDYGDMVRSVCTHGVDAEAVRELTEGFRAGLGVLLTDAEKASLFSGILWVTGELALRYLTDYYSEERYFVGKTREQCLKRSRELLGQLGGFLEAEQDIRRIIEK